MLNGTFQVDQQQIRPPGGEISWTNTTIGVLPPKRSLKSWLALSHGDTSNLPKDPSSSRIKGDNNQMDNRINPPFRREWTAQCVAHNN